MKNENAYTRINTGFLSKNNKTRINTEIYIPDGKRPKAILQIAHGMAEYFLRYDAFAAFLAGEGYVVVGNDHLGHGKSVNTWSDYGYFSNTPLKTLLLDMHQLRLNMEQRYPDLPYLMLGHSMGSFLLRAYLSLYGKGLSGAVIMGTGFTPPAMAQLGMGLTKLFAAFRGWHYRSLMIQGLTYNRSYKGYDLMGNQAEKSWLTKDIFLARKFGDDPLCGFLFTLNGHRGLFEAVHFACLPEHADRIPKDLPLLLVSGGKDPVGGLGRGVVKTYDMLKHAGIRDLTMKLYPGDRHEILNETDRETVMADILEWMDRQKEKPSITSSFQTY